MDGTTPAKSLEERSADARKRQTRALKALELARVPAGADIMGIVARQRLLKRLMIRAGLVVDDDGTHPNEDTVEALWKVLEEEAKADVLADLAGVVGGRPSEHAHLVVPTAREIPESENGDRPH